MEDREKTREQLIDEITTLRHQVTELKTAKAKQHKQAEPFKEQARLLDLIFEHSLDSIVLLDKEYNFIRVSETYAKSCQRDSSEFPGHNHFEFYPSPLQDEFNEAVKDKITYRRTARPFVFPDHPEWGTTYWDLGLVPILDSYNDIEFFLFTLKDVTERIRGQQKIEAALKEKEVLLRELYHRTKNNMSVISSLLALQAEHIDDKTILRMFKDMENRIQSMALVHHKLYQSNNLSRINLREYIEELTSLLLRSYASCCRIALELDAEDIDVLIDTAMPCGLILNELISNAIKHAFPGRKEGTIHIELHRVDETSLELIVADNGIGVSDEHDLRNMKTLGVQTVIGMAESQLAGTVHFAIDNGMTCHLTFRDDLYEERV